MKNVRIVVLLFWVFALFSATICMAVDYQVGPGKPYNSISEVPWESLLPGDSVYIHWRDQPYREKWVINRAGTLHSPIRVSGVAGPAGQLPVISGDGATTRLNLNYWNEARGIIKIGGSSIPSQDIEGGNYGSHIILENLDIQSARPPLYVQK